MRSVTLKKSNEHEKDARLENIIRVNRQERYLKLIRKAAKRTAVVGAGILFFSSIALGQVLLGSNEVQTPLRIRQVQIEKNLMEELMPSERIDENTPYVFVNGYKMYRLGYIKSTDPGKVISPCNQKQELNAIYTPGVYVCPTKVSADNASTEQKTDRNSGAGTSTSADSQAAGYVNDVGSSIIQGSWLVQDATPPPLPVPVPLMRSIPFKPRPRSLYPDIFAMQLIGIEGTNLAISAVTMSYYYSGSAHYNAAYGVSSSSSMIGVSGFPIAPGDAIYSTIDIDRTQQQGKVTMVNVTQNVGFTVTLPYNATPTRVAWLEENPIVCPPDTNTCGQVPLPTGTVFFGMSYMNLQSGMQANYAMNGLSLVRMSVLPKSSIVTMYAHTSTGLVYDKPLAIPSAITSDGTSFSVQTISAWPAQ